VEMRAWSRGPRVYALVSAQDHQQKNESKDTHFLEPFDISEEYDLLSESKLKIVK